MHDPYLMTDALAVDIDSQTSHLFLFTGTLQGGFCSCVILWATLIHFNAVHSLIILFQTFPSRNVLKPWVESVIIFKAGSLLNSGNWGIFASFLWRGVGWRERGRASRSFLGSAAARVERSGLSVEEWNLWDRMGGKLGSDFSLTGGRRGRADIWGINEDSLKAART